MAASDTDDRRAAWDPRGSARARGIRWSAGAAARWTPPRTKTHVAGPRLLCHPRPSCRGPRQVALSQQAQRRGGLHLGPRPTWPVLGFFVPPPELPPPPPRTPPPPPSPPPPRTPPPPPPPRTPPSPSVVPRGAVPSAHPPARLPLRPTALETAPRALETAPRALETAP